MSETTGFRDRLSKGPHEDMVTYVYAPKFEVETRRSGFEEQMWIHFAYLLMLEQENIIGEEEASNVANSLTSIDITQINEIRTRINYEDLYSCIEARLSELVGPIGGILHTGRSRNDLARTHHRMMLRELLLDVMTEVAELWQVLLDRAEEQASTVMPGYTHWKQAQPITLGYYLSAIASVLVRDVKRLMRAYSHVNLSPLGAAALSGTGFPINRVSIQKLLAFDDLLVHSYDAVCARDDILESVDAVKSLMILLKRVSQDLLTWSTDEFDYIEISDLYAGVSSIMPQKKNPDSLAKIRSLAGEVVGRSAEISFDMGGTPFDDEEDAVTLVNAPVYLALEATLAAVKLTRGVLETLSVHKENMARQATEGFSTTTEVADVIVREAGLSFREAHRVVGRTVIQMLDQGKGGNQITLDDLNASSQQLLGQKLALSEASLNAALDPWHNVAVREGLGGSAPKELNRMLTVLGDQLQEFRDEIAGKRQKIQIAKQRTREEIDKLSQLV